MYKMKKYHLFKCNEHCKKLHVTDMEQSFNSLSDLFEQLVVYCNQVDDTMPNHSLSVAFNKLFFSPLNRDKIYQRYKANFNYMTSLYSKFDAIPVCTCTYFYPHSLDYILRLVFLVKVMED